MYTMGENSIFKRQTDAKKKTEDAVKNEQEYMNFIDNMVNQYINGTGNGGISTPTEPIDKSSKSDWATIEKIAKEIAKDDTITSETEEVKVVVDGKRDIPSNQAIYLKQNITEKLKESKSTRI